jgi:hypothetical protein
MAALKEEKPNAADRDPNDVLAELGIEELQKLLDEARDLPPGDADDDPGAGNSEGDETGKRFDEAPPNEGEAPNGHDTGETSSKGKGDQKDASPHLITPTGFKWRDPATIPTRQFIYGRHVLRKYVTALLAPGAVGKSSLTVVEALAIVIGRPLLGIMPNERSNVWLWNGEDRTRNLSAKCSRRCSTTRCRLKR